MPAAIAVPALIGAGGAVATGVIGARAAGKAAKQQVEASDRALAEQRRVYESQKQLMAPYVNTGADIFGRLAENYARGAYQPGGQPFGAQSPFAAALQQGGMGYAQGSRMTPLITPQPSAGTAVPRSSTGVGPVPPVNPVGGRSMPGRVRVQAPTGEIAELSEADAQRAIAAGAQRIG